MARSDIVNLSQHPDGSWPLAASLRGAMATLAATAAGGGVRVVEADAAAITLDDLGGTIVVSDDTAATLTVPLQATVPYPLGARVAVIQGDAGAVTIDPASESGPTIRFGAGAANETAGQWARVELVCIAPNEWVLSGDLAASGG
jgi:hypothetical protein